MAGPPIDGQPAIFEVVAGDPDGLDDIAAVVIECDSAVVYRIIARPSAVGSSGCLTSVYAANDTVPITALIPRALPGFARVPMDRVEGGLYRAAPICSSSVRCPCTPCLQAANPSLGPIQWSSCIFANSVDFLAILPPAVPSPVNVFITYLDVEFRGIRATVYDAAGETAARRFANVRMIYTTPEERSVAP